MYRCIALKHTFLINAHPHTCVIVVSFLDQSVDYKLLQTVSSLLLPPVWSDVLYRTFHAQQSDIINDITLWVPNNRKNLKLIISSFFSYFSSLHAFLHLTFLPFPQSPSPSLSRLLSFSHLISLPVSFPSLSPYLSRFGKLVSSQKRNNHFPSWAGAITTPLGALLYSQ